MLKILRLFSPYIVAFVFVSVICGLVYGAVQQTLRQDANDPQIELAENMAATLATNGGTVDVGPDKIDLTKSLSTFLIVVDKNYGLVGSNAYLNDKNPIPPAGIFQTAKSRGEYRVTWQPASGVREALVVVPVNNAAGEFVVVGRSLREVEIRENQIFVMSVVAWLILIAVSFIGIFLFQSDRK